jgi:NAD(P)-dependent dehydrogenase (short-subunit alcohol dehydrogenase family)
MPVALITGASRGIGLEFARQYAGDGWDVVAACRNPAKAEELHDLAIKNKKIIIEELDVNDEKSIKALATRLKDHIIDVLINNAGIARGSEAPTHDNFNNPDQNFGTLSASAWMEILRTNTVAPIMVTEALAQQVAASTQKKVAMISSRYGSIELNRPDLMAYASSKAALNISMRKVALAMRDSIVVSLHPGWVQTDMGGKSAEVDPATSVRGMRKVIDQLKPAQSGAFISYDGKAIPW